MPRTEDRGLSAHAWFGSKRRNLASFTGTWEPRLHGVTAVAARRGYGASTVRTFGR